MIHVVKKQTSHFLSKKLVIHVEIVQEELWTPQEP